MLFRIVCKLLVLSIITTSPGISALAYSAEAQSEANEAASDDASQSLAPGFLMHLSSAQDQSLNGTFRIQADNTISLPYSVKIDTKGMTLKQFQAEIVRLYRPYFTSSVNVKASVKQRRYYVDARGRVKNPGTYLVKKDTPLDEIISMAGGIGEDLTQGFARIEQGDKIHWVSLSDYFKRGKSDIPAWRGGDRVFFQKEGPESAPTTGLGDFSQKVQVLGEVRTPGELTHRGDADAYYYLVKTGGPTREADLDKVEIIRTNPQTGSRESVSLGPVDRQKVVKEGDILLFHPTRQTGGEKFLQNAAIISGILTAIVVTIIAVRGVNR